MDAVVAVGQQGTVVVDCPRICGSRFDYLDSVSQWCSRCLHRYPGGDNRGSAAVIWWCAQQDRIGLIRIDGNVDRESEDELVRWNQERYE